MHGHKVARSNIVEFYDSKVSNLYYAEFFIYFHKTCSQSEDDCQSAYELLHSLKGHVTSVNALSFHPTGLFLASGCIKGWVNIWSLHVSVSICITELSFFFI